MNDIDFCKLLLSHIADGDSGNPRSDARKAGRRFCKVLSPSDLASLETDLADNLAVGRQAIVPKRELAAHTRQLAVLEGALQGIRQQAKIL